MKNYLKIIGTSMLVLALSTFSKAEDDDLHTRFGVKGGANLSNLYTNDGSSASMLLGFHAGIFGKFPITKNFAIQPELYYITKGAKTTYNNILIDGTVTYNLNYLELPVLFVINFTENLNIHLGPYASYLVSGNVTNNSNINAFDFDNKINTNDYNKLDAGIAAGIGIDINRFGIGARYNYSMTNIGKERSFLGYNYTYPDANNGVISLYVSFSLL